ncbi:MAG: hypothetical protein ACJ73J_05880 [Actinomycetes bacterium]
MDKIIIERHPSKIDKDGKRHDLIRMSSHFPGLIWEARGGPSSSVSI